MADAPALAGAANALQREFEGAFLRKIWVDLEGRLILTLKRSDLQTFLILSAVEGKEGLGIVSKRPPCPARPPALAAYLRAHVENGRLARVSSDGKTAVIVFFAGGSLWRVILETGGRKSGIFAADGEGRLKAALRWDGPGGVFRPNAVYVEPSFPRSEEKSGGLELLAAEGVRICPAEEGGQEPAADEALAVLRAEKKLRRRIDNIKADIQDAPDPETFRMKAHALSSSHGEVNRGMESARVPDPENPGAYLEVELDPRLGPGENIDRLHRLARKAITRRRVAEKRLAEALIELERGPVREPAQRKPEKKRDEKGKKKPFARYRSSDGWTLLAGRNRVENDLLVKEGKPWDLWLHARGGSGAHVLVVKPGKEARVPERTLAEAAGLAAALSSLSGNASVEVSYTELGRVSKPKGAGHGKVVYSGEKTIRIAPGAGSPLKQS